MKGLRIFERSIRDGFKSIGRNFGLSFASIMCTTITLILVALAIVCAVNVEHATKTIESELSIIVYLDANISEEDRNNIETDIRSRSAVESLSVKTKDEWKLEMAESEEDLKTVLDFLGENPLMDTFTVYVNDVRELSDTAKYISSITGVETVKYGENMVESIITIFDVLEKVVVVIVIALVLVTAFLISNTIKLTIFSRRNEIEIMRLVGASNTAIKLPFVVEGFIIGLIGSIIPICITIYGYVILYSRLHGHLFTNVLTLVKPFNFVFWVSLVLVAIGSIVGMFGSLRAVRKHLKI